MQSLDAAVAARSGRIVENESGLAAFDRVADDLERWMGRETEKIVSLYLLKNITEHTKSKNKDR